MRIRLPYNKLITKKIEGQLLKKKLNELSININDKLIMKFGEINFCIFCASFFFFTVPCCCKSVSNNERITKENESMNKKIINLFILYKISKQKVKKNKKNKKKIKK